MTLLRQTGPGPGAQISGISKPSTTKGAAGGRRMDIGFIGLGQMGFHMARRLLEAGHRVLVLDRRREAMDRLAGLGAQGRDSPRALADEVETVMASLPTPEVVLAVATGAD